MKYCQKYFVFDNMCLFAHLSSVWSGLRLESLCDNSLSGGHSGLALGRSSFCAWSELQGLQCVQSQQHRL